MNAVSQSASPPIESMPKPAMLDVESIRRDFPILQRKVHGKPLIWLDSAATAQKPQAVIDRVSRFYEHENSNVHRGTHTLAEEACDACERARTRVAAFLGAFSMLEIVFVRGTTEGLNLLAAIFSESLLRPGDEIVLTAAEHHANIVPWQFAAKKTGAVIRVAPVDDNGDIILEEYEHLLGPRTRVVSITHISNVLGTVMPIREMTALAKRHGATVVIDGAQGVPHRRVDVQEIGCDFYVFSGHKLFAPMGIGAVYGRMEMWEQMPPWQGGGNMVEQVTFENSTFAPPPKRFEAGTPALAPAVGLGAAIDYLNGIGLDAIEQYETALLDYALEGIRSVNGLRLIGQPRDRGGVISFVMDGIPDMEVARVLDAEGIAVRAGTHCAQPILARFGLESTVRPSFAFYNTRAEADMLVDALRRIGCRR
ncbi:MAG: cysteine desulfurase [Nitrosomonadales bacterium]|nr:cysteine desulfurase [Nitrosomonadales bacterium]